MLLRALRPLPYKAATLNYGKVISRMIRLSKFSVGSKGEEGSEKKKLEQKATYLKRTADRAGVLKLELLRYSSIDHTPTIFKYRIIRQQSYHLVLHTLSLSEVILSDSNTLARGRQSA